MNFFKGKNKVNKELFINNELLLKELKCSTCEEYMAPPISQCMTGHSLCSKCADKNACLKCSRPTSTVKNLHLESIALKVKYPCRNYDGGCFLMFSHAELRQHQRKCLHRIHRCLLNDGFCTWTGRKDTLVAHANYTHATEKVMNKDSMFVCKNFKNIASYVRLISAFDEVFWFYHAKNQNTAYWIIQYLGPDIDCENYTFDFKCHRDEDKNQYTGFKKMSCLKNSEDIRKNIFISSISMNMDVIQNTFSQSDNCIFSVKMRKSKISQKSK